MPGWTCIDHFLTRMAKMYNYVPGGSDHGALRRWASRWRGRCHTLAGHMSTVALPHLAGRDAAPPAGIGMPLKIPRVVEAVGTFTHVPMNHLAAFSLNVKRAGYLRGGDCYGAQNLNFSCWAEHLARMCKRDDDTLLGSLGVRPCVS